MRSLGGWPWKAAVSRICLGLILTLAATNLSAREKNAIQYGMGLIVNLPLPESEVVQVVQDVVQNGIIRGTREYNKDEYVSGATVAISTRAFPEWTEGGKVFYKVRLKALDPRNFKDSSDVGTLAVRYVVLAQDEKHTVLRIDARFVEDFRHIAHASDGSVESAEYKDIHEHIDSIELMKAQTAAAQKAKEESSSRTLASALTDEAAAAPPVSATTTSTETTSDSAESHTTMPPQTLEQRVLDLRKQVERLVKSPGAPLKSAPFHTASTLQSLPTGTEVLVVISTPYWLGVETHEGQHGWILRDELEQLP
ncbi:MAG TPA: hypothetical protein VE377_23905 [Candidatus Dormibacteraeota bacterium]|nr:hypothetical protein [Candidatus Dormibacteraeota bacterium]